MITLRDVHLAAGISVRDTIAALITSYIVDQDEFYVVKDNEIVDAHLGITIDGLRRREANDGLPAMSYAIPEQAASAVRSVNPDMITLGETRFMGHSTVS